MKKQSANKTTRNTTNKLDHEIIKALRGASFSSASTRSFKNDLHDRFLQQARVKKATQAKATPVIAAAPISTSNTSQKTKGKKKKGFLSPFMHQNRLILIGALSLLLVVSSTIALRNDRGSQLPFSVEMARDTTSSQDVQEDTASINNEEDSGVIAEVFEKNETRVDPDEEKVAQTPSTQQATKTVIDNSNLQGTPEASVVIIDAPADTQSDTPNMETTPDGNLSLSVANNNTANTVASSPPASPDSSSIVFPGESRSYAYSDIFQALESLTLRYTSSDISTTIRQAQVSSSNIEGPLSTVRGHETGSGFTQEVLLNNPNDNQATLVVFYNSDGSHYYGNVYIKRNDGSFVKTHEIHARDTTGFHTLSLDLRKLFYGE